MTKSTKSSAALGGAMLGDAVEKLCDDGIRDIVTRSCDGKPGAPIIETMGRTDAVAKTDTRGSMDGRERGGEERGSKLG